MSISGSYTHIDPGGAIVPSQSEGLCALVAESVAAPDLNAPAALAYATSGFPEVTNAQFISALFPALPDGGSVAVCTKYGDPKTGGWPAQCAVRVDHQCPPSANNYFNCSTFRSDSGGEVRARKSDAIAFHVLVLDDVGTKVPRSLVEGLLPTYEIETSPGNSQVGFALTEPITDLVQASRLQDAAKAAGLCDPGAMGVARWVRLPVGINAKLKYTLTGPAPSCKLLQWNPATRYTVEALLGNV